MKNIKAKILKHQLRVYSQLNIFLVELSELNIYPKPTHPPWLLPSEHWNIPAQEYWHAQEKPNHPNHVKHFTKVQLQKVFLLGAVGALNDCWALGTFNSPNPFSYNSPILEESTRDCEHIFQLLTFLPYINDTWKCVDYKCSFLMVAPEEVSIGTQTFGHLSQQLKLAQDFQKRPSGL